jgi:hypothetical protein
MGLLHGLVLLVLGALGASTLVARREEGRKALAALEPYQGLIGVAALGWGTFRFFGLLVGFRHGQWLVSLVDAGLLMSLGLLLGVGVIQSFLEDPKGRANFDGFVAKLTPYRQTLGVVAMVLGGFLVLGALF